MMDPCVQNMLLGIVVLLILIITVHVYRVSKYEVKEETLMKDKRVRLCKNCVCLGMAGDFWEDSAENEPSCGSPQAPFTDFVEGRKEPWRINHDGKCPYYFPKEK